ncbi:MAG: hypothetical protein JSV60_07535, partial [Desulfobacterales bacterium]
MKEMEDRFDRLEDEIELMDFLRVIWKWKYLIFFGTLACAVLAGVVSLSMPKVYRIAMLVEPGVIHISEGGTVHIDTPENIKAIIEAGAFNKEILSSIGRSGSETPISLKFTVNIPRNGNVVRVSYETSVPERGLQILDQLGGLLVNKYADRVAYFQNEYGTEIALKQTELAQLELERKASEWQIKNFQERIDELRSEIEPIRENISLLIQKRDRFLSKNTNKNNTTSGVLYATAM